MQVYCRKKQVEGQNAVHDYATKHKIDFTDREQKSPYKTIAIQCIAKWVDERLGPDWSMVDYCVRQQTEAYESLR